MLEQWGLLAVRDPVQPLPAIPSVGKKIIAGCRHIPCAAF